jgi:hypothetical protein
VGKGNAVVGIIAGYDSAEPLASPPAGRNLVAFYGGGDTPHVWTLAEIQAQPVRYRLPIWVRSNPTAPGINVANDVARFLTYLHGVGCPKGSVTSLDLETAVDVAYVNTFGQLMHSAGYLVLPYGSSGNLFKNPVLDGYWVDWPGKTSIPPNCVGVQYSQGGNGAWDNDLFLDSIPFWDAQPQPPLPPPLPKRKKAKMYVAQVQGQAVVWQVWDNGTKSACSTPQDEQMQLLASGGQPYPYVYETSTFLDALPIVGAK